MSTLPDDSRATALCQWVEQQLLGEAVQAQRVSNWSLVSGDASFRRYFRCRVQFETETQSLIAVDAPPEHENNPEFVRIAQSLKAHGVNVPDVFAADFEQGFLLLSDCGDQLLLPQLNEKTVDNFYAHAMADLLLLQQCPFDPPLAPYSAEVLQREMLLFPQWFVAEHLGLSLAPEESQVLAAAFAKITAWVEDQPQVPVHRDYHARNIMIEASGQLAYIDFQDALQGPITYDLVSLLRDSYARWPSDSIQQWALQFKVQLETCGYLSGISDAQWLQWFYATAVQRHLKVVGIFARLNHRDGKATYLNDIPQTFTYLLDALQQLPELGELEALIVEKILPAYQAKNPELAAAVLSVSEDVV